MLTKTLAIVVLLILFYIISKSADLIVVHLRKTGEKLGIKIFFLGIILGIMTSLPEMAIGINSTISGISTISFGNLLGGIIVLFGLIMAVSAILNRKIHTEKKSWPFLITLLFLFLPLILGFKGQLNYIDGILLIIGYVLLIFYLYKNHRQTGLIKIEIINRKEIYKHILFILIGIIGLIISSELIVRTTIFILQDYNISIFIVGLLFYAIGTNLPELIIAIRSFSNLIGSAMSNTLMLGILSAIKTIEIEIDLAYIFLMIFTLALFIVLFIFYKTDKLISRREGFFLLLMYLIFISGQIFIQIKY
jgi:cation:H+ antiporter